MRIAAGGAWLIGRWRRSRCVPLWGPGSRAPDRHAWIGGILYVVALLGEAVISAGQKLSQDDSPAKIAQSLADHHTV
jgi:hypothetical protein